jgi:hypothetical protein
VDVIFGIKEEKGYEYSRDCVEGKKKSEGKRDFFKKREHNVRIILKRTQGKEHTICEVCCVSNYGQAKDFMNKTITPP